MLACNTSQSEVELLIHIYIALTTNSIYNLVLSRYNPSCNTIGRTIVKREFYAYGEAWAMSMSSTS